MRVRNVIPNLLSFLAVLLIPGSVCNAQEQSASVPMTIAIFSDSKLPAEEWPKLIAAVGAERNTSIPSLVHAQLQVVRGDAIAPGIVVDSSISIYLHGTCDLSQHALILRPTAPINGALGWTESHHGQLEPFAHVDCNRIAQLLAPRTIGLTRDERNTVMATAIAHVILHEWNHIATQSAHHAGHGLTKSTFNAQDLMIPSAHPVPPFNHGQ